MADSGDDDQHRGSGAAGWWLLWGGSLLLGIVAIALLSAVFPVAQGTAGGWAASAFAMRRGRGQVGGRSASWLFPLLQTPMFIGLALLLGAAGLTSDDHPGAAASGAVLGAVLLVLGAGSIVVAQLRRRRREIDAEVERYRREQDALQVAHDESAPDRAVDGRV
jgi:hypothetical protein